MMKYVAFFYCIVVLIMIDCGSSLEAEFTYPIDGSTVSGIVVIDVGIVNDLVVTKVEIFIDDTLVNTVRREPYQHIWNTFGLPDSSTHELFCIAHDRDVEIDTSDVITVLVSNGSTFFADNFEHYNEGSYPYQGGWYQIWPGDTTSSVIREYANSGTQSFKLDGTSAWPSTDGFDVDFNGVTNASYTFAVMVPGTSTGALVGFFRYLSPELGEIFNGVNFHYDDHFIYVQGAVEYSTGRLWTPGVWYDVRVEIDFADLMMDVWINDNPVAYDVEIVPRDSARIFAVATEWQGGGVVYYDDIEVCVE